MCIELGEAYAGIACAPQVTGIHDLVRRSRPDAWPDQLGSALDQIERLLRSEPRVAQPAFAASQRRIRLLIEPTQAEELLIKADCNVDNTLSDGETLTGIIDWEQACIGSRWIHYGIVLDHTHFLDWDAVRTGLEEVGGAWSRDEEELVLAAGFLCVWRKIIEFDARSTWFSDPGRQEERMRAMGRSYGASSGIASMKGRAHRCSQARTTAGTPAHTGDRATILPRFEPRGALPAPSASVRWPVFVPPRPAVGAHHAP